MNNLKCKYLSDDFSEVCVNGDCPVCADFCPVTHYPEICKFAEVEGQKRTNGDMIRAKTDDGLADMFTQYGKCENGECLIYDKCSNAPHPKICHAAIKDWLQQEAQDG